MRKYRKQSLSCGNFVKKPSTFRLDINLETDNPSKTEQFRSIIRLSTGFILETNCPSETDNSSSSINSASEDNENDKKNNNNRSNLEKKKLCTCSTLFVLVRKETTLYGQHTFLHISMLVLHD